MSSHLAPPLVSHRNCSFGLVKGISMSRMTSMPLANSAVIRQKC